MLKRSIALAVLATAMVGGAAVDRANAVVGAPVAQAATGDAMIQTVRWVCSATRCVWEPWPHFTPRHSWAMNWQPPKSPGCFYEKRRGRWREVCPK